MLYVIEVSYFRVMRINPNDTVIKKKKSEFEPAEPWILVPMLTYMLRCHTEEGCCMHFKYFFYQVSR